LARFYILIKSVLIPHAHLRSLWRWEKGTSGEEQAVDGTWSLTLVATPQAPGHFEEEKSAQTAGNKAK
jgi:hypothetical protein